MLPRRRREVCFNWKYHLQPLRPNCEHKCRLMLLVCIILMLMLIIMLMMTLLFVMLLLLTAAASGKGLEQGGALQPAAPLHHHRTQGRSVSATLVIYSTHTCTHLPARVQIYTTLFQTHKCQSCKLWRLAACADVVQIVASTW